MMRMIVAVGVVLAATPAAAAPPPWSITWPPDWRDATAEVMAIPEEQAPIRRIEGLGGTAKVTVWRGEDGLIQVVHTTLPVRDDTPRGALISFEAGARDSTRQSGVEIRYEQHEDATAMISEHVVRLHETQVRARRITGFRDGGIVSVAATCFHATPATCETALRSLSLERTGFVTITELPSSGLVDEDSPAYRTLVGIALASIVIALLAWTVLKRRKR